MRVFNIRDGFACNSSSSHSLFRWKNMPPDPIAPEYNSFGWDGFILRSTEDKLKYLCQQIYGQTRNPAIASELSGYPCDPDYEVDYDSQWSLPYRFDMSGLHEGFVSDFRAWLCDPYIGVRGGNDNNDDSIPDIGDGITIDHPGAGGGVARRDPLWDSWTVFNRVTGRRIRCSFLENASAPRYGTAPELVDMSITDYCDFGCGFCYRGSTEKGQHADVNRVFGLIEQMARMQVFECAIGGGEPTSHPDFNAIVRKFAECGIVPNFTTRNVSDEFWTGFDERLSCVGAVAISVNTAEAVGRIAAIKKLAPRANLTVQYIIGQSSNEDEFRRILDVCAEKYLRITLLGYKTTGRGDVFGKREIPRWAEIVVEYRKGRYVNLGIDTVLAQQAGDYFETQGVDPRCLEKMDGTFSMFVDAVHNTAHRASYDGDAGVPIMDLETAWRSVRVTG